MAENYKSLALAEARSQALTPQAVRSLDYSGVAALAGVTIGPGGESAPGFRWKAVRRYVGLNRRFDQRDAMLAAITGHLQTHIRSRPGYADATVTVDEEHRLMISRSGFDPG